MGNQTGTLITFSGIDGAGKSSVIKILQKFIRENYGLDSKYVWCKFGAHPLTSLNLSRIFFYTEPNSEIANSYMINSRSKSNNLYGSILLAYHLAQIGLLVKGYLAKNQIVFCDRYIYDTMVDLQYVFKYSSARIQRIFSPTWIPVPEFRFLLDVPEHIAMKRKSEELTNNSLRTRRQTYIHLAKKYQLSIINSSQPIDAVAETILIRFNTTKSKFINIYE